MVKEGKYLKLKDLVDEIGMLLEYSIFPMIFLCTVVSSSCLYDGSRLHEKF